GGTVYRAYPNPDHSVDPHGLGYCPPEDDSLQREWEIKLKNIKNILYTECGRTMARQRHRTMREFLRTMEQEVKGDI
ncbi:MAG TPA: metal-dependent phosphohydrolase, partial [Bacillota bacterium]|nr:metal-dependent phosphohydrolase [Bacillota bacterium]